MQFKKALFHIELIFMLLALLGKLGFLIAFHNADPFEATGIRTCVGLNGSYASAFIPLSRSYLSSHYKILANEAHK